MEEKLLLLIEKINEHILNNHNNYSNKDKISITFEYLYRYKTLPDQNIVKSVKKFIEDKELNNKETQFSKNEILKFCFLLTKYELIDLKTEQAQESLDTLAELLMITGLEKLTFDEIKILIVNNSKSKLNPHVELFTLLEPHIIKEINNANVKSLIRIFNCYRRSFLGTDFFIKTIGFYIGARVNEANIDGK